MAGKRRRRKRRITLLDAQTRDRITLRLAAREKHDRSRFENRTDADRDRAKRHVAGRKKRGVRTTRRGSQLDHARPRVERRTRLVEPAVAIGPETEKRESERSGLRDVPVVFATFALQRGIERFAVAGIRAAV